MQGGAACPVNLSGKRTEETDALWASVLHVRRCAGRVFSGAVGLFGRSVFIFIGEERVSNARIGCVHGIGTISCRSKH